MIKIEIDHKRGEITLHLDDEAAMQIEQAARDVRRPAKVLIGDPGAMLILRHVDYVAASSREQA